MIDSKSSDNTIFSIKKYIQKRLFSLNTLNDYLIYIVFVLLKERDTS